MCDIAAFILAPRARSESAPDQGRRDGIELGERLEHEAPLCQPRVRDAEARFVHDLVAVEQEVQVDRPRPVALAGTDTSKLLLHGQQALQERIWSEVGRQPDSCAEETRLVDHADGIGLANRGNRLDFELGIGGESSSASRIVNSRSPRFDPMPM